jgi:7-carboxy-7-deazaguanine synthase
MDNKNTSVNIIEIFSSLQGEGPYIGVRQIFVRFANCNLNCRYCDTPTKPVDFCKSEIAGGMGEFSKIKNPLSPVQLAEEISRLNIFPHHSLSLTGGEPLLQADFIFEFLEKFKNLKIYLETNGTLVRELKKVIKKIDIISMDIKLESSTGIKTFWEKHAEFLKTAIDFDKEVFVKAVISSNVTPDEIAKIADFMLIFDRQIPLILQSVDSKDKKSVPDIKKLLSIQEVLLKVLPDVRIIPQVHKILGLK